MNLREEIFQHKKHTRSIYGRYMQQSFAAVYAMDRFLGAHPQIRSIIEFGTGTGGLSLHLACLMAVRGGELLTIDNAPDRCFAAKALDHLGTPPDDDGIGNGFGVRRLVADLYSPETFAVIRSRYSFHEGRTLIFCDGGDKPRELAMCAPLLGPGDFLMAHDWQTEVHEQHIPAGWVKYQPWQEQADAMGTMQLFLKRA